jgi:hypothetical protein
MQDHNLLISPFHVEHHLRLVQVRKLCLPLLLKVTIESHRMSQTREEKRLNSMDKSNEVCFRYYVTKD